jgi:hypothetical protein
MAKNKKDTAAMEPSRDWEAEEDARTMARHHEIRQDPARHAKAVTAAQRMQEEKAKEAAAMKKVAHSKPMDVTAEKVRSMPFRK